MSSVGGAECVHYEDAVGQVSQLLAELLAVLGLFCAAETCVLKDYDLAVLHLSNSLLCDVACYLVVLGENYLCIYKLSQSVSGSLQGELLLRAVLRLAEVRAEDNLCAVLDQLVDGRESCGDTVVVGDLAVLHRYVEVNADEHLLALFIQVFYILLVQFDDGYYFLS